MFGIFLVGVLPSGAGIDQAPGAGAWRITMGTQRSARPIHSAIRLAGPDARD
jgi:hypothetical protein